MRAVRERPRVFAVVGWAALVLVLAGALIGATASSREGEGGREALEAARLSVLEARSETRETEREVDELAHALTVERRQVVALRRELGTARELRRARKGNRR